jgi:UV DNA damage endonuclease
LIAHEPQSGTVWPRRLGFAVKVVAREGLKSNDSRRWQSGPHLSVSIEFLHRILEYLDAADIRMYRISSDFVPYATLPGQPRFHDQIRECRRELAEVGRRAAELGIRLSLHPSQYVLLNAVDPAITARGIRDVDTQAELLDAMEHGPEAVVVLHVGGAYGNKEAALARFIENHPRLSEPGRRRLVVENDDSLYTVQHVLRIHEAEGVRVVFDHQHHLLNPGTLSIVEAARRALSTWPAGVVPKVHFSSPKLDSRVVRRGGGVVEAPPLLSQHADYLNPFEFASFLRSVGPLPFDVMLEAKKKDAALLKLREDVRRLALF